MISINDAIAKAKEHLVEAFADEDVRDVLLEGVDKDTSLGVWIVTLSFLRKQLIAASGSPLQPVASLGQGSWRDVRAFKCVYVDLTTGEMTKIIDYGSLEAAE